jgi:hypothetical protein
MAVRIQYDKVSHPAPSHEGAPWGESIPYIQFDREPIFYGGKWGQVVNVTLNGTLFENVEDYPKTIKALEDKRDLIIECFGKQLKTFEFEDDAGGAFGNANNNKMEFTNVVVESIEFPDSGYHALLEFVIRLKCYEQDFFMAQGVLDPQDQFDIQEGEDGSMNVTHTVTARGVDYTDAQGVLHNGFDNAIDWVNLRLGEGNMSSEGTVRAWDCGAGIGKLYLVLLNQNEKINRLEGVYSITESFIAYLDEENAKEGIKAVSKYSVEMSQSLNDDFRKVSISGNIKGGKNTTMQELRDAVIRNDDVVTPTGKNGLYEIAKERSGMDGSDIEHPKLHRIPMSYTLEENLEEKTISVKASFDTNPLFVDENGNESRHFFDYTVDVNTDEITQITKLNVKGKLEVRGLLSERQCYIQKFLDNTDLMDFLYTHGKSQYDVIMNVCYKCDSGGTTYWAKATPEQVIAGNTAQATCQGWPPYGNALGLDPELCWELHPCAESMSVSRNESQATLELSATFSDTDSLMVDNEDHSKGCYDKASFDVTVNNPVEYLKVNASGQKANIDNDYNGHWAIQRFGINTRAKSNTKVSLTMRQDSSVAEAGIENKLRTKAEETQKTLNDALLQNGTEADYDALKPDKPALVYDINKNISHKESAAQSLTSTLERSYVPEAGGSICVDLPEPNDQKQCFDCRDENGVKIGGEIFAYQPDPNVIPDEAYAHCDLLAESHCDSETSCWECYEDLFAQGIYYHGLQVDALTYCENNALDPDALFSVGLVDPQLCSSSTTTTSAAGTTTTSAPSNTTTTAAPWRCLTPAICKDCYTCYAIDIPVGDVQGIDMAEAESECLSQFGVDVNNGDFVFLCEDDVETKCYNCVTSDDPPITLDPPGSFNALTLADAQLECDNSGEESTAVECSVEPDKCWTCINVLTGDGFTYIYSPDESEALDNCRLEGESSGIGAMNVDITPCDGSVEIKCWQCSDGDTMVMAYTEAVAGTMCVGGLDSSITQPIGCP